MSDVKTDALFDELENVISRYEETLEKYQIDWENSYTFGDSYKSFMSSCGFDLD